jgi:hypothetical protein
MPIDDEPPSGAHADSIGRQAPPDAKRPAGFVASAIHAARLGVMAGRVSLVLVGLICALLGPGRRVHPEPRLRVHDVGHRRHRGARLRRRVNRRGLGIGDCPQVARAAARTAAGAAPTGRALRHRRRNALRAGDGGNELWQQLLIWGTQGRTPLRRELDVQQAWELAADGRKLSRPDLDPMEVGPVRPEV